MKFIIEYTGAFSRSIIKTDELSIFGAIKTYFYMKKLGYFLSPKIKKAK